MPAWVSARPEAQTTALNPTPTTGTWWRRTRARVHDAARLRVQATNSLILDFKKPVARDALLRVSEIAALDVADVSLAEQTVVIRRSKTDQEGAGAVQFLGKPTVERIRTWLRASGLAAGALFRVVNKSGRVYGERLTARSIRTIITRRARAAGVEGRVSGHSLRVGSAQSLATSGASLVEMQVAGRWESPNMPGHYAQGQLASQGAVAKLRYGTNWTLPDLPAP
jgi:integrase